MATDNDDDLEVFCRLGCATAEAHAEHLRRVFDASSERHRAAVARVNARIAEDLATWTPKRRPWWRRVWAWVTRRG